MAGLVVEVATVLLLALIVTLRRHRCLRSLLKIFLGSTIWILVVWAGWLLVVVVAVILIGTV